MKIKNNKIDIIIEILCLTILIGTVGYLLVNWGTIPDKIPTHYDGMGNIDGWGEKSELIFTLAITWILYIAITVIEQFPQVWNTGIKVTEENRERVYRTLKYMVHTLKLILVIDLTYLTIIPIFAVELPGWYTMATLVVVFGDIIFWLVRLFKVK